VKEGVDSDSAGDPRGLRVRAKWPVSDPLVGEALSIFRGRGFEFDQLRPYAPGDEISSIEWNVYARTGELFSRQDVEERELTVLLLVDLSSSAGFGSGDLTKRDTLRKCAALLAGAALGAHDRVGLAPFASDLLAEVPTGRGRRQRMRIEDALGLQPRSDGPTDLAPPLGWALQRKSRALVFLLSDFIAPVPEVLDQVAARHDLIAIRVADKRETELASAGLIEVRDPETGAIRLLDTSSRRVREAYGAEAAAGRLAWDEAVARLGIARLELAAGADPLLPLQRFLAAAGGGRG